MSNILQIIIFLTLNFLIIFYFKSLSKYFNLYDYPKLKRKRQKIPISLFGGFIFFINFFLFSFFDIFFNEKYFLINIGFDSNIKITFFLLIFSFVYLIGYIDDKIDLRPSNKLFLLLGLTFLVIYYNPNFNIKTLRSDLFNNHVDLFFLGSIFSTICVVFYINALNMFDGINLISFLHFLSIPIVFVMEGFFINFSLLYCFSLIVFGYLNIKNMSYLGDSGIYILTFISGLMIIFFYNSSNTSIENILIIIFLPIVDSFRLFFTRIYNGKNPFLGDENHFHHICVKRFGFKKTISIYISFLYLPIIVNYIFNISFILLTAVLYIYILLIKNISIKTKIKNE